MAAVVISQVLRLLFTDASAVASLMGLFRKTVQTDDN
jgi:hypothetical protein